jgi:hypothetical protein
MRNLLGELVEVKRLAGVAHARWSSKSSGHLRDGAERTTLFHQ